jgi:hypothetical protein
MTTKHSFQILQTGSRYVGRRCPSTRTELRPGEQVVVCHKNDEVFSWDALPVLDGRCPFCEQQIAFEEILGPSRTTYEKTAGPTKEKADKPKAKPGYVPAQRRNGVPLVLVALGILALMGICGIGGVIGYRQLFAQSTPVPTAQLTARATEIPTALEPTTASSAFEVPESTNTPQPTSTLRPTPTDEPSPTPKITLTPTPTSQPIVIFRDSFDGPEVDTSKWDLNTGAGNIVASGGVLRTASSGRRYPYIYSRYDPFPSEGNFQVSFHFRYPEVKTCGVGLIMTSYLVPVGLTQDEAANRQREAEAYGVQAGVWQDEANGMQLWFRSGADRVDLQVSRSNTDWNELIIKYFRNRYTLYFNGSPAYTSLETSYRPQVIWIGHPAELNTDCQWSTLEIDEIKVESLP